MCSHHSSSLQSPGSGPSQVSYDPSCAAWGNINRFWNSSADELIEAEGNQSACPKGQCWPGGQLHVTEEGAGTESEALRVPDILTHIWRSFNPP